MFKPRRQYAIGDIHGHYNELMALREKLLESAYDPYQDQLILLGDLVDVGPDSKKVVEQCMKWQREYDKPGEQHIVCLYGNHEDLMIDALNPLHPIYTDNPYLWLDQGGDETLKSYTPNLAKLSKKAFEKARKKPDQYLDDEHIRWLSNLPYFYIDADHVFVHAGLPNEPIEVIVERARKNDQQLNYDMIWLRDSFIYSSFQWGKRIIFGHQPTIEPLVTPNKIGLNTMPRNEGKLTCLEIPSMSFIYQPKL